MCLSAKNIFGLLISGGIVGGIYLELGYITQISFITYTIYLYAGIIIINTSYYLYHKFLRDVVEQRQLILERIHLVHGQIDLILRNENVRPEQLHRFITIFEELDEENDESIENVVSQMEAYVGILSNRLKKLRKWA